MVRNSKIHPYLDIFDEWGNGNVSEANFEEWDDGNRSQNDGWDFSWKIEEDYKCDNTQDESFWYIPEWGNNERTPDEECDDNNMIEDDGWTNCTVDKGYFWEGGDYNSSDTWDILCGDGVILTKELGLCDDNNTDR